MSGRGLSPEIVRELRKVFAAEQVARRRARETASEIEQASLWARRREPTVIITDPDVVAHAPPQPELCEAGRPVLCLEHGPPADRRADLSSQSE